MNTFSKALAQFGNTVLTENGGLAHSTTGNKVYDLFSLGAAYRRRTDGDCILLFKNAFEENAALAMKCLFWLRDCRGGAGERRFFRVVYKWFAEHYETTARKYLKFIPEFGRWDDLFILFNTPLENDMMRFVAEQLKLDLNCKTPSILGKWMPSETASSRTTIINARKFIKFLGITAKQYRKYLVSLRSKIKIVETLMSQNRWDEIEFDKIPSKAGLIYRNAFARREIIAEKYKAFIKNKNSSVNAKTLYPYEIVQQALRLSIDETERVALEKYWNALPNYCEGNENSTMCVVDTSGSMCCASHNVAPIHIAISLGMYCAERLRGPFKDHFISFSRVPQYIAIEGIDFVDKVTRIYKHSLCQNTNLQAVFDLLYDTAMQEDVDLKDVPSTIVVISDMEIDEVVYSRSASTAVKTMMEEQREKWTKAGLPMPRLVYWNVNSRETNKFLDDGPNVSYVGGASPVLFQAILKGKTGIEMMLDILNSDRYKEIAD